jgi:hypothetical protein
VEFIASDDVTVYSTQSQFDGDSTQGSDVHEDMASLSAVDLADIDQLIAQLNTMDYVILDKDFMERRRMNSKLHRSSSGAW